MAYSKQTWSSNELITADKLNRIEDGIPTKTSQLTNDSITPTSIGLGNVENKSSATIRGELTKANVTTALGYTPPTTDECVSIYDYNPEVKTSAMTKVVGKDSSGKLWTAPVEQTEVVSATESWLNTHVSPSTGYVIDDSLSIQGAAADAAKVGESINVHDYIYAKKTFPKNLFGIGALDNNYIASSTWKPYRVSNAKILEFSYDIIIFMNTAYAMTLYEYLNGSWVRRYNYFQSYFKIAAGTRFAIELKKIPENTSSTAVVSDFVNAFTVYLSDFDIAADIKNEITTSNNLPIVLYGNGRPYADFNYEINPEVHRHKVTLIAPIILQYDVIISAKTGYVLNVSQYINGAWSNINGVGGAVIPANTKFTFSILQTQEGSSDLDIALAAKNVSICTIETESLKLHEQIVENQTFITSIFHRGSFSEGSYSPSFRTYRVSMTAALTLNYTIIIRSKSGFRLHLSSFEDGRWNEAWGYSFTIKRGTPFGVMIARVTEDTSETADVVTFVDNCVVQTAMTERLSVPETEGIDLVKIETFMSRFYDSETADAFVFFTDPHLMGIGSSFSETTFNEYLRVLKNTYDRTSATWVLCGGDWLNNGDTKAQATTKLGLIAGKMREAFGGAYLPIVGNHDYNYIGVDDEGTRIEDLIEAPAMKNLWFPTKPTGCYYSQKLTNAVLYVLNTRTEYDTFYQYDLNMLDWFATQLNTEDPPHAIVAFHTLYQAAVGTDIVRRVQVIGKIIEGFNAHTTVTLDSENYGYSFNYDFTGKTGHIDFSVVGHSHADFTSNFGGVPIIGTINMQAGGVPSFDLMFADYTNHKLYCTRIGTGSNREITI